MEIIDKVQRQLKHWYTTSCTLIIITFIALTIVQSFTLIKLQKLPIRQPTAMPTSNAPDHGHEQEQEQELKNLIKKQQSLLPMLTACIEALPDSLHITKLLIEPTVRIEYNGKGTYQAEITELLNNLQKAGYQEIMQLDIRESADEPDNAINFHLILNILA